MTRVLSFMAHPDDSEILVGGTLFLLKHHGWEVGIATMTAGDCGASTGTREEISRVRLREAQDAAAFLGAAFSCAGFRDVEVFSNAQNLRSVVELVRAFDPDVIITHSPADYMVDHEEASRMVRAAAFAIAMPLYETAHIPAARVARATPALYYSDPVEGIDALGDRIRPEFYVNITDQMGLKRDMLSRHKSQRDWLRAHHHVDEYLDRMTGWGEQYGGECGVRYAEGFRQHLGHGYPHEPRIQSALSSLIRKPE
ncbi:MAG TPA: PIG-L family deacetylase [Acidobacteriota bacterium]|nr:PIG-L family deacetylase [Acidobacteriota bacterium]